MRPFRVYPILGLGLLSFVASPILVRLAGEAPGLAVAVWRTVFAVVLLVPWALRTGLPEVRRFSRRDWVMVGVAGLFLALHFVTWIESLYHTTVASASVLVTSNPLFIALLGFLFLKERLTWKTVLGIVVAVVGAALISVGDAGANAAPAPAPRLGNSLALTAAFVFSVYLLIGRVVRQHTSWIGYVFPLYAVVALVTLVLALALGTPLLGYSPGFYGLCLLMALGPSLLGHGSFNYAVRYFPAAKLAVLGLLEPVGASLAAYLAFGEAPGWVAVGGMALVLLGVAGALRRRPVASAAPPEAGAR